MTAFLFSVGITLRVLRPAGVKESLKTAGTDLGTAKMNFDPAGYTCDNRLVPNPVWEPIPCRTPRLQRSPRAVLSVSYQGWLEWTHMQCGAKRH